MSEKASKESQYSFAPLSSSYVGVGGVTNGLCRHGHYMACCRLFCGHVMS